jgi:hypothetical protein
LGGKGKETQNKSRCISWIHFASKSQLVYRGAATGVQADNLGRVLRRIVSDDDQNKSTSNAVHLRGVGLEGSTAEGGVGTVLRNLPGALAGLEELVDSGGSINHVGDPGVPII